MAKPKSEKFAPTQPPDGEGSPQAWWPHLKATERDKLFAAWLELDLYRAISTDTRKWLHEALHPDGSSITQLIPQNRRAGNKLKDDDPEYSLELRKSALYAHALVRSKVQYKKAIYDAGVKFNLSKRHIELEYSSVKYSNQPIPPLDWFAENVPHSIFLAFEQLERDWNRQRITKLSEAEIAKEGAPLVAELLEETLIPSFWRSEGELREFVRSRILNGATDRWEQLEDNLKVPEIRAHTVNVLTQAILKKVERICIEEIRDLLQLAADKESQQNQ